MKYLNVWLITTLPWPTEVNGSKLSFIAISFYHNIVRKIYSVNKPLTFPQKCQKLLEQALKANAKLIKNK
jgi:hypothetical protein